MELDLNTRWQTVRRVLEDDSCTVTVSRAEADDSANLYTVVAVHDRERAKALASMVVAGSFEESRAFKAAQVSGGDYLLVFEYVHEQPLYSGGAILEMGFAMRKAVALSLVTELAQAALPEALSSLLLEERNINLDGTRVYFNYFLDVADMGSATATEDFYSKAALAAYEVLSRGYAQSLVGKESAYPDELQVMRRRAERAGFKSYSQLIAFIKDLPDEPKTRARGIARLKALFARIKEAFRENGMRLLIIVLVIATLVFLIWQVSMRLMSAAPGGNEIYNGVDYIGDQHLKDDYV